MNKGMYGYTLYALTTIVHYLALEMNETLTCYPVSELEDLIP